jgi:hypothetical protein
MFGDEACEGRAENVINLIRIRPDLDNSHVGAARNHKELFHSDQQHIVEHLSRPSLNYLIYQAIINKRSCAVRLIRALFLDAEPVPLSRRPVMAGGGAGRASSGRLPRHAG